MISQSLKYSLLAMAILLLVWSPVQAFLLNALFGLDWRPAILDGTATSLLIGLTALAIVSTLNFYHPALKYLPFLVLGLVVFSIAVSDGSEYVLTLISGGPFYYIEKFHPLRSVLTALVILFIFTITWLQTSKRSTAEDDQHRAATEKMARDAELANLRQQLQPHFLFNSLNSINALIGSQPERARVMVQQLSDFLRGTIKKDDSQVIELNEELRQLRLYLEIEKVRFGHRLLANIENDNASLSAKLPPLLLQPVVENAIKFGLYDTVGETIINIKTKMENQLLLIEVENPFDPSTASPRQGTGFGLSSLQRRLYLLYGRNDLLSTNQLENVFITQLKIPQQV
jgi:two-component system, LytTR family, sensor kinase